MTAFEVVPAIDLQDGEVVNLVRGELDRSTTFETDPVAVAERWEAAGARLVHVVDIDGAVAGEPRHTEDITRIVARVDVAVQVGGGIRNRETLLGWLDAGASRVVLGTAALRDPDFLEWALTAAPERVVVALDAKDGELQVSAWREASGLDLLDTAKRLAGVGVRRILCTDIGRDGMLSGPNIELMGQVADAAGVPVIASGGVSSAEDLRQLAALAPRGVEGAIVGRALYTGALDLSDALAAV